MVEGEARGGSRTPRTSTTNNEEFDRFAMHLVRCLFVFNKVLPTKATATNYA